MSFATAFPTTTANDATVGTVAWTNPNNAQATDGVFATAALTSAAESEYLKCTGFGFSIPAGATIQGVVVTVLRKAGSSNSVWDASIKLVKGGTISGNDLGLSTSQGSAYAVPTTLTSFSFGAQWYMWGLSLAPSDVNASTFGCVIAEKGSSTVSIDSISMTVYYTLSTDVATSVTSPSTTADDATVGTVAWTNPTNAEVSDGVFATNAGNNSTGHYVKANNFGFSIPAGATINGILVGVLRKGTSSQGGVADSTIKLLKGGTYGGNNYAQTTYVAWQPIIANSSTARWSTTVGTAFYGGCNDLWGQTWASSDINSSTFGVGVSPSHGSGKGSDTGSVDYISIQVFYTPAATGSLPAPVMMMQAVKRASEW
jgi:hypothetical protein